MRAPFQSIFPKLLDLIYPHSMNKKIKKVKEEIPTTISLRTFYGDTIACGSFGCKEFSKKPNGEYEVTYPINSN
jgi:hypothetical protein